MPNKIRPLRLQRGLTLSELARAASTTPAQIQKLERGERRLTDTWLRRLAPPLQCRPADLLGDDATPILHEGEPVAPFEPSPSVGRGTLLHVPLYEDDAQRSDAGILENPGNRREGLSFEPAFLASLTTAPAHRLALVRMQGDAMVPTLGPGDLLLLDRSQNEARQDGIYALDQQGTLIIRRLQLHPSRPGLTILADNPSYAPGEVGEPSRLAILGRVVWYGRKL